ncbi:hypothetical protein HYC85_018408 [Camellia sinensis]|uniref:Uncharacterized protein n=1 Tax=Camellia sinensis TaxID=4442 RepID=A0A7J7GWL3_CAMSI|nr:hypothetical protein HYC85_018408 [Camellia sinensis]
MLRKKKKNFEILRKCKTSVKQRYCPSIPDLSLLPRPSPLRLCLVLPLRLSSLALKAFADLSATSPLIHRPASSLSPIFVVHRKALPDVGAREFPANSTILDLMERAGL